MTLKRLLCLLLGHDWHLKSVEPISPRATLLEVVMRLRHLKRSDVVLRCRRCGREE